MILKALKILPYILASVNPSTFLATKKNATDNTTENEFTLTIKESSTTTTSATNDNDLLFYSNKVQGSGYNNALAVYYTRYTQTFHNGTTASDYVIVPTESLLESNVYTSSLIAMQITPYNYLKEVDGAIPLWLNLTNDIYISTDEETYGEGLLSLQYDVITSTEDYFSTYIDISNYTTEAINQTIYNDLTSEENGFTYNQDTYTKDLTTASSSHYQYTSQAIEVEIISNETNYIYILITPYIRDYTTTPYCFLDPNGASNFISPDYGNLVTFTGTYLSGYIEYEVIDIPGLMFEVLTMPFTFISVAFNLTLFPGTPYQLNISNLFLSILGILIFIFIIKMLIKAK